MLLRESVKSPARLSGERAQTDTEYHLTIADVNGSRHIRLHLKSLYLPKWLLISSCSCIFLQAWHEMLPSLYEVNMLDRSKSYRQHNLQFTNNLERLAIKSKQAAWLNLCSDFLFLGIYLLLSAPSEFCLMRLNIDGSSNWTSAKTVYREQEAGRFIHFTKQNVVNEVTEPQPLIYLSSQIECQHFSFWSFWEM